jgi:uncharacterized membrane protein
MKNLQRLLILSVILLIVINLGLLGFIWKGHRINQTYRGSMHSERMHQHVDRLGDRLQLEEEQKQTFHQAFRAHNQEMQALDRKEQMLRRKIHEAAFRSNQNELDSLTKVAQQLAEKRIETYTSFSRGLSESVDPSLREELIKILSRPPRDQAKPRRERARGNR